MPDSQRSDPLGVLVFCGLGLAASLAVAVVYLALMLVGMGIYPGWASIPLALVFISLPPLMMASRGGGYDRQALAALNPFGRSQYKLWSPAYWNAYWGIRAPAAPTWLRRLTVVSFVYFLLLVVIGLFNLFSGSLGLYPVMFSAWPLSTFSLAATIIVSRLKEIPASDAAPPPPFWRRWTKTGLLAVYAAAITALAVPTIGWALPNFLASLRAGCDPLASFYIQEGHGAHTRDPRQVDAFTRAIVRDPNCALAYVGRASAYKYLENYEAQVVDDSRALETNPRLIEAYMDRAKGYAFLQKYDAAIADYTRAIEIDPDNASIYYERARLEIDEAALADYTRAIELDPKQGIYYRSRGDYYLQHGDFDKAVIDFTGLIETNPQIGLGYRLRAFANHKAGHLQASLDDLNQGIDYYIKANIPTVDLYVERGEVHHALGNDQAALADFEQALKLTPNYSAALVARGNFYRDQGNMQAALADYQVVINSLPLTTTCWRDSFDAMLGRGMLYYQIGDFKSALADFEQITTPECGTRNPDALYGRALTNDALGNMQAALVDYQAFLKLNPKEDDRTAHARERIKALGGS